MITYQQQKHDGDLGHNATVFYEHVPYGCSDGTNFCCEEVSISDKRQRVLLTAKEALSLLKWLEQEKSTLEKLEVEQEQPTQ